MQVRMQVRCPLQNGGRFRVEQRWLSSRTTIGE
jgi:hypothetical protein